MGMTKERDTIEDMINESSGGRDSRDSASDTVPVDLTPLAKQMLRAEEAGRNACLVVLDGVDVGKLIPLDSGPVVIGRGSSCDIILSEDGISRQHAKVEFAKPNRLAVEDLSSTNGTFVAGKRVINASLKVGEKVLFGRRTMLRFVLEDTLDHIYQQELFASSTRDGLTGIPNRKYLKQRIAADLSFAQRHKTPFTFMRFDIDNFRQINSAYGYQTGDQALVAAAQTVSEIIRTEDVFCRFGDDDFGIIAVGIDLPGGRALGDRIRNLISERQIRAVDTSGETLNFTVSVGVATVDQDAVADVDKVLAVAEDNLDTARQSGNNRVVASQII